MDTGGYAFSLHVTSVVVDVVIVILLIAIVMKLYAKAESGSGGSGGGGSGGGQDEKKEGAPVATVAPSVSETVAKTLGLQPEENTRKNKK